VDDEALLRTLRAADPAADEGLRDWASSDDGRRVYESILVRGRESAPGRSRNPRITRLLLVAGAAAVVVAAVAVGLVYGLNGSAQVASVTTTATVVQEAADRVEVLARLVAEAETVVPGTERPGPTTFNAASNAIQAQALGIIGASERGWAVAHGSLTRATYASWLWRAFGDRLKQVKDVSFTDLGALSHEVRNAVLGVAGADILRGEANGLFEPDATLSLQDERDSIKRLEQALGASAA
jgi:hypothetical protein